MKKRLICACMCVVMLLSLAACGQNAEDNTEEHSHDSNMEEEYLKDAEVELKLALSANMGDAHYKAAEMFADEVKEKTEGVVRVEICDARQFGEDKALLVGMKNGEDIVDILVTSVSNYTEIEPRMDITALPFLLALRISVSFKNIGIGGSIDFCFDISSSKLCLFISVTDVLLGILVEGI